MPRSDATGRPPKPIDIDEVEKLASYQCTDEEMGRWFNMTRENFNRRKTKEISEAIERGKCKGRTSLRRAQFVAAMKGNSTMLVWMGKQLLGQKDVVTNEHSGDITVHDGAKERLLSKLAGLVAAQGTDESSSVVN